MTISPQINYSQPVCHEHSCRLKADAATNARDAARWRAVRGRLDVESGPGGWWFMCNDGEPLPIPATVDEAADRLVADREARDAETA